jgi:DNA-binding transcriptional LysR family regulator
MELENELDTKLLIRGKRQITLTAAGIMFQQRAREIVELYKKTKRDIVKHNGDVGGVVSIGCVETSASLLLPDVIEEFHARCPIVQYEIFTANGDGIREKIDGGYIDMGIMVEPVETAKYDSFPLPFTDTWGVLMRADDPLAVRESVTVEDIAPLPLLMTGRQIVSEEISRWFGESANRLHIVEYHNLITNTMLLIERGLGYSICVEGAYSIRPNSKLRFIPLSPVRKSGHVLAWKKNRIFGEAASLFLNFIREKYTV